ncbi:uncharacterized protein LOC100208400 [Hydra vulgaris]|uniref:uncharacterized protein LOC100208400 n=1 Tax=Hydra vulgaris TaxID=6087 RepID=UPI001F5E7A7C|nr:beta-1,3-galactosyltransferase GALT1 [Hydra vulgaris]
MQLVLRRLKWQLLSVAFGFSIFYGTSFFHSRYMFNFKKTNNNQVQNGFILVIGILSKLNEFNRRSAIRFTWLKTCKENEALVYCRFFTDSPENESNNTKLKIKTEIEKYGDIVFMPFKGGHNFGLRLVWMLNWFSEYSFNYFLRIDDDYFLCLESLLLELPSRPKRGLYWGYIHCRDHVVRVDEGWMLLSRDIIDEALSKLNTTLQCHPFGDQAVAMWIRDSKINITYFMDNDRVIHAATAFIEDKYMTPNICQYYLALHGAYPSQMLKYWILSKSIDKVRLNINNKISIPPFDTVCKYSKEFDWRWFYPHVKFEPKPCHTNPVWSITHTEFKGREDIGSEVLY